MSIMPEGGWGDFGHKDPGRQQDPSADTRGISRSYLSCKVCERGALSSKKVFRLSGPAVVIGFILLVPSFFGMILSALMFLGVIAATGQGVRQVTNASNRPVQSSFDASFRLSCARSFRQSYQATTGSDAPLQSVEKYCECALSIFKETGSESAAAQECSEEVASDTLPEPGVGLAAFYRDGSANTDPEAADTKREAVGFLGLFGFLGSVSAVAMGIASFVGGLLGWLLVMRKHVLQCDVCGAIVNAS